MWRAVGIAAVVGQAVGRGYLRHGRPTYNASTMLRRFTAVLIFHFLLCVGIFAAGLNAPHSAPHWPTVAEQSSQPAPETPEALSDVNDHALMDDKGDLPDQLEALVQVSAAASEALQAIPLRATRSLSAVASPPHRPPKAARHFV